jgi:Zn-dependent peptidase ImmA (M78 family)/DNA-binding XRE family transcriptional regulator
MPDKANITPKVLKWARESARMDEATAASKVSVPIQKLKDWEEGITQPTIRQAKTLAKSYRRPFALLFLTAIPKDFQPLQDFRKRGSKTLGTASIFIIREIQQKQSWISEVYEENNEPKVPFVGKFSMKDDPSKVSEDIIKTLNIRVPNYETENPIKEWISKAEKRGIFISRTSFIHSRLTLDSDELQGFAIADSYAPFIFINSDDWEAPQLFTLVHELVHIWIAASGVSNEVDPDIKEKEKFHPVELYCNEVAANALIPLKLISNVDESTFKSTQDVFKVSRSLGVSSFAFLVRALNLKLISFMEYERLKQEAIIEYKAFLKREEEKKIKQESREKKGGPNPYLLRLNKNSRLFTQIVLDAFHGGSVEATLASNLLNTPVNKFSSLEAQLYK